MLIDIIKSRRSIRRYSQKSISNQDLRYILEAGRLAPSGGNEQPWLFGVISDRKLIEELVKCCRGQKWINTAPVVIALCTKRMSEGDMDVEKYRLGKLSDEIYDLDPNVLDILCPQEHQALIAAENMMLSAAELGIGSCLIAYVDVYKASKVLRVPNSHLVTYLVTLGYAENTPEPRSIKEFDDIVFSNTYDR